MNLAEYDGQRVEATGTRRAQEQVASTSGTIEEQTAKGTSGTPTVETTTELKMKRLAATDVLPIGGSCK